MPYEKKNMSLLKQKSRIIFCNSQFVLAHVTVKKNNIKVTTFMCFTVLALQTRAI